MLVSMTARGRNVFQTQARCSRVVLEGIAQKQMEFGTEDISM